MSTHRPAIAVTGLRKSYGDKVVLDGIDLNVPAGTIFALLGPNGAGKTTAVNILSTLIGADAGEVRVAGHDVAARARRGPRRDRRHRPVLRRGRTAHRRGEPDPDGRSAPPGPGRGPPPDRGAARAVRPGRCRQEARHDVLRRHAAPARPGDDPGRRAARHLPRRADHRPGPAQPARHVGDHPRPRRRRRHRLPHHAVPGGGGPARRPDRAARPRPADRRGDPGGAQAAHPRRPHPSCASPSSGDSSPPPASSAQPPATTTRSPCRCPATARSGRCAPCWTGSTAHRSRSRSCPCTPPISTTCSSPSPANPTPAASDAKETFDEHHRLRRPRLAHDAAPQPPPHAAVPVDDADARRHPGHLLLLFVYVFGGTLGAGLGGVSGGRAEYANYVTPGILLIAIAGGAPERRPRSPWT